MWEAISGLVGAIIGAGLTGWSSLAAAKRTSNDRQTEVRERKIEQALELGIQIRIKGQNVIFFLQDTLHAISNGKHVDEQEFGNRLEELTQKSREAQANATRAFIHVGSGTLTFNSLAIVAGRKLGTYIHRVQETQRLVQEIQRGNLPIPPWNSQLPAPVQQSDFETLTEMINDADKARVYLNETYKIALQPLGISLRNLPLAPNGHRQLPDGLQDI
jgi:hypothetical protein